MRLNVKGLEINSKAVWLLILVLNLIESIILGGEPISTITFLIQPSEWKDIFFEKCDGIFLDVGV